MQQISKFSIAIGIATLPSYLYSETQIKKSSTITFKNGLPITPSKIYKKSRNLFLEDNNLSEFSLETP